MPKLLSVNKHEYEINFSLLDRHDYFEYLDEIYAEHNKRSNEKDPELSKLI